MSQLLLEALDGFIMIITTDGQLFYVSESVKDFLGYSQASLIHQSLYKFLHIDDHKTARENLVWSEDCDTTTGNIGDQGDDKSSSDDVFTSAKCEKSFACRIKCTMSHGGGFYKMFQCRGRMREIHIKKREIDCVEHGLFAVISPINAVPVSSTMEMVRKEAILASQRHFHLDQNLNLTETYPLSSPYKNFIDPRHLRVSPVTPTTPTPNNHDAASFFPPSFTCSTGNYLHPGYKRRDSSSSGIADDSSTNDENASSEGSVDSSGHRRRVSFRLDEEKPPEKREKIGNRRMSAPAFGNQPMTSPAYDISSYNSMLHPGTPNWLYPSPYSNPLLGYQELLHRMDRSYLSPGFLSPLYPPYSPGGMFPPYSPFLKRASSFPNIAHNGDAVYPSGDSMLSPRISPYDPFAYFLGHPAGSRRSSDVSPSRESLEKKEDGKQDEEKEKVEDAVEAMEDDDQSSNQVEQSERQEEIEVEVTEEAEPKLQIPTIKIEHCEDETVEKEHLVNCDCISGSPSSVHSAPHEMNGDHHGDTSPLRSSSCEPVTSTKVNEDGIQETLADIAQNFTSKLDSIRSTFTLSLDRNVASCLGKNK